MALYVSAGTRRRRTVVLVVVAAVIALVIGLLVGRQQVPSVNDRVSSVRTDASDIAIGLERLDIEYQQALAGSGDSIDAGVVQPIEDLRAQLIHTLDQAPWLVAAQRADLLDQLAEVESSAKQSVPLADLQALLTSTGSAIRTAFGVTTP